MNMRKLNEHLERHRENPTLRAVYEGRETLEGVVKGFYGFEGKGKELRVGEEDPSKVGQKPDKLVDLVDGFYERPIDRSHLEYGEVREGVKNAKPDRMLLKSFAAGLAFCLGEGLAVYFLGENGYDVNAHLHLGLSLGGFVGVPLLYSSFSPSAKAEKRSKKQMEAAFNGDAIKAGDEGCHSLGYVNSAALRSRAIQIDSLLALGGD